MCESVQQKLGHTIEYMCVMWNSAVNGQILKKLSYDQGQRPQTLYLSLLLLNERSKNQGVNSSSKDL